jgi:hypothetical protein
MILREYLRVYLSPERGFAPITLGASYEPRSTWTAVP